MQSNPVSTGDAASASQYDNLRDDAYAASVLRAHQETTPGMTLHVENGAYYINGVRYFFAASSSPTFTAPTSNPRIDVLSIDSTGTLNITEGTEAATPAVPSYPENQVAICEIYHVVGETAIYTSNSADYGWASGQGYIENDVRPVVGYGPNFAAIGEDLLPDSTNTRSLGSSAKQWKDIYAETLYSGGSPAAIASFGGTGADGALSISSGTTTIDLGGSAFFIKNYTSISITGTGSLKFANPNNNGTIVNLKSQGDVTLTSSTLPMIDVSGLGAQSSSHNGYGTESTYSVAGVDGGNSNSSTAGTGGAGGASIFFTLNIAGKRVRAMPGASGGAGGNGGASGGAGGNGGGALIIECNGALDFPVADGISVSGLDGANGTTGGNDQGGGGGGGGGAGGTGVILYRQLTSASGTFTVKGGAGGNGGNAGNNYAGTVSYGGGGGGGGANLYSGGGGGSSSTGSSASPGSAGGGTAGGTGGAAGTNANNSKTPGGGGGGGGEGAYYIVENTEFS